MRVLIVDPMGAGLDLAIRAQAHGHDVKYCVFQDEKQRFIGRGFVPIVDDPRPWLRWSELTIATDNTKYLHYLEAHRKEGGLVLAASPEMAQWEIDRELGQKVLRESGIPVPVGRTFTDYDTAISFAKKTMGRYVSKPSGDGTADKALSYCSAGPADMIFMLARWKKLGKNKGPFILQEFIPGVEMGVSAWHGPHGFNEGFEENFEFKKLMNDDMGVATGEQGTVLRYVRTSKLARKVLIPLSETLKKMNYVGDVDVNCIIDEKGTPWPLE